MRMMSYYDNVVLALRRVGTTTALVMAVGLSTNKKNLRSCPKISFAAHTYIHIVHVQTTVEDDGCTGKDTCN